MLGPIREKKKPRRLANNVIKSEALPIPTKMINDWEETVQTCTSDFSTSDYIRIYWKRENGTAWTECWKCEEVHTQRISNAFPTNKAVRKLEFYASGSSMDTVNRTYRAQTEWNKRILLESRFETNYKSWRSGLYYTKERQRERVRQRGEKKT